MTTVDNEKGSGVFETLAELYGEDLAAKQMALEAEAYRLGEERFRAAMAYKASVGQAADTQVVRPLVADLIPKLSMKLIEFIASQQTGRPGKKAAAFKYVRGMDPDRIAYIALRTLLNRCADQPTPQQLSEAIGRDIEGEARYGRLRDIDEKNYKKHIQNNIKTRSADHFKKAYARAVEASMQKEGTLDEWDAWGQSARIAVGLKCLELCIELGVVAISSIHPGDPKRHQNIITITDEVAAWVAQRTDAMAGCVPARAPCVVPPKPWTGLRRGGYWDFSKGAVGFVRGLRGKGRKRYREVDLSRPMAAVNAIQNTPWRIHKEVLEVVQAVSGWKNPVADLDSPEVVSKPEKPSDMEENPVAFKAWKRAAARTWAVEKARRSRRLRLASSMAMAEKLVDCERIWFPYNLDFRGRIYALPSFSPQGGDVEKGLLLLADPSPMGETGGLWLRLHLANTAGLDKKPFDERIKWATENEGLILACAENPLENLWWATEADSPFCFLGACFEFAKWKASGFSKDYPCGIAVAFDGTCSGIQHYSAMLRDEVGGAAVNLVPGDVVRDIYKIVADKIIPVVEAHAASEEEDDQDTVMAEVNEETGEITEKTYHGRRTVARWWLAYGITRSVTKRSVMTLPYGSSEFGFVDQILEDTIGPAVERLGEQAFPAPNTAARYMAKLCWNALKETVVAAVEAMSWLQKAAGALASQDMPAHWVTPIGFPVWQEYVNVDSRRVDTVICGSIRLTMTIAAEDDVGAPMNKAKQVSGIAPNFVHSMDASHMMLTAEAAAARGVGHFAMIHDSFGTCPGNSQTMYEVVRQTLVDTYENRDVMLEFYEGFCNDLTEDALDKIPELPKKGTLDLQGVLKSRYCFL